MKKGFTLIELICVIAILGLIALIAVPTVNTMIQNSRKEAYQEQIDTIAKAARTYMTTNSTNLPAQQTNASTCVDIEDMQKEGILSKEDITNPCYDTTCEGVDNLQTSKNFTGGVKVAWNGKKYIYTYPSSSCK